MGIPKPRLRRPEGPLRQGSEGLEGTVFWHRPHIFEPHVFHHMMDEGEKVPRTIQTPLSYNTNSSPVHTSILSCTHLYPLLYTSILSYTCTAGALYKGHFPKVTNRISTTNNSKFQKSILRKVGKGIWKTAKNGFQKKFKTDELFTQKTAAFFTLFPAPNLGLPKTDRCRRPEGPI